MSAFTDIIKLAYKNGGKIPREIPAHYVRYAYAEHRASKGLRVVTLPYSRVRDGVIYL